MSILAIVVSYFPDADVVSNIQALAREAGAVVVVDNTPADDSAAVLEPLNGGNISIHYNRRNMGIGAALNVGLERARGGEYEWLATFDQDSCITPGLFQKMLETYAARDDRNAIGILCPRYLDRSTGVITGHQRLRGAAKAGGGCEVMVTMTSGNLVRTDIFSTTGRFDEALFIDYVDYEFCIRCRRFGIKTVEVQDAILDHKVGKSERHVLWGRQVTATNHSPLRYYYAWRNRTYLCLKCWRDLPFLGLLLGMSAKSAVLILLYEKDRAKKFGSILRGVWDGLRGKLGAAA